MEQDNMPTGPKERPSNAYLRYSSFAFQLLGGIGLAAWSGHALDVYWSLSFPVFMLSFALLIFGGMMYKISKELNRD